jgi:hypothetical protein
MARRLPDFGTWQTAVEPDSIRGVRCDPTASTMETRAEIDLVDATSTRWNGLMHRTP